MSEQQVLHCSNSWVNVSRCNYFKINISNLLSTGYHRSFPWG